MPGPERRELKDVVCRRVAPACAMCCNPFMKTKVMRTDTARTIHSTLALERRMSVTLICVSGMRVGNCNPINPTPYVQPRGRNHHVLIANAVPVMQKSICFNSQGDESVPMSVREREPPSPHTHTETSTPERSGCTICCTPQTHGHVCMRDLGEYVRYRGHPNSVRKQERETTGSVAMLVRAKMSGASVPTRYQLDWTIRWPIHRPSHIKNPKPFKGARRAGRLE